MRSRLSLVMGCVLLVALTLGLAAPLSAASPELVINDMDAARAYFEASADGWSLSGAVSYVYADSVMYQDGQIVRPHTDVDVWLWAWSPSGYCTLLRGTTNLGDMPAAGAFTSMTSAAVTDVTVDLDPVADDEGCLDGTVSSATAYVTVSWLADGAIRNLKIIEPGVQTLVGKERDATATGTVRITSLGFPSVVFSSFSLEVIQNYNEVYFGG